MRCKAPGKLRAWVERRWWTLLVGWLLIVLTPMGWLMSYAFTPGEAAAAPSDWPADSAIARRNDGFTLVMVLHPRCGCSRASVAELSWLMTRLSDRVSAHVVFVVPDGMGEDWARADLWQSASLIDGVAMMPDVGGVEAARFGAKTSGQVYLYNASGMLLFAGGITANRGHQGDNVGRQRIVELVTAGGSDRDVSDVYGCAVDDEGARDFVLRSWR